MARLTNRPSFVHSEHSHLPSPTPDPQTDQENIDPQQVAARDEGKQPAVPQRSQMALNGANPQERAHKRRRITPEPREDSAAASEAFTRYFDPNQNADERRKINRQQRELNREVIESREQLLADGGDRLAETVQRADKIFENVKQTGDACVDSRFLVDVGALVYKKSAALVAGDVNTGIDLDDFLSRCMSFMRTGEADMQPRATQRADDADEDDDLTPLNWDLLGRAVCFRSNSRPPVPSFLLGPLSLEKKQRIQTQRRARQSRNTATEARPEALDKDDLKESEQNSLTAQCTALHKHLKVFIKSAARSVKEQGIHSTEAASTPRGKEALEKARLRIADDHPGVPLFEYVINPRSFGQTIENLFYISFLIKEGSAGIGLDNDGLPVLFSTNPRSVEEQRDRGTSKHQAVLSLDYGTWQDLIKAYNLTEPMIPHRSEVLPSQPGARGWYT